MQDNIKRLIFLKVDDFNPEDKKIKKSDLDKLEEQFIQLSIKEFKNSIKENKSIKIIKEIPDLPQLIIEFPEDEYKKIHNILRSIPVVHIIDAILPTNTSKKEVDKEPIKDNYAEKLKEKMSRFNK